MFKKFKDQYYSRILKLVMHHIVTNFHVVFITDKNNKVATFIALGEEEDIEKEIMEHFPNLTAGASKLWITANYRDSHNAK